MGKKEEEDDDDDVSSVEIDDDEEEPEEDEAAANDLSNTDIITKYRAAGDIANRVLAMVTSMVQPGAKVVDLCKAGDDMVTAETGKVFNAKKGSKTVEKGSAFPTCVSVNSCVGHMSPLMGEEPHQTLAEGDVVKIDLGAHIDGYIAVVASTAVCGSGEVTGRAADVVECCWKASELAQRMFKEGAKNKDISEMISKVADAYKCNAVEGVLSHQMKKHVIDANKVIINKASMEQQVKDATLELNDVFAIDIVMSTGEGKPKPGTARTTVHKRDLEEKYNLKMKTSRAFFSEVNSKFPTLPFTLRAAEGAEVERTWKMGVIECVKHGLFTEYPVLYDKPDALVAHYKFTIMLLPSGKAARITSGPPPNVNSECAIEDEGLLALLAEEVDAKKKKKPNKKKKKGGGGGGEGGDDAE